MLARRSLRIASRGDSSNNYFTYYSSYSFAGHISSDSPDSDEQEPGAWPLHRPPLSIARTSYVESRIQLVKANAEYIFHRCMFTVHMRAVGEALRKVYFDEMRDSVINSLHTIRELIREIIMSVRLLVGGSITLERLLEETPYRPRPPPFEICIDPRIPDTVLLLRPRLRQMHKVAFVIPYRASFLLQSPVLNLFSNNDERFANISARIHRVEESLNFLGEESNRLRRILEHPDSLGTEQQIMSGETRV